MKLEDKVILTFISILNFLFWALFLITFLQFNSVFSYPNPLYHVMTDLDRELIELDAYMPYANLRVIIVGMKLTVGFLNLCELYMLIFHVSEPNGYRILPIPSKQIVTVLKFALMLYLPCYFYIKYLADFYHLWMSMVPSLFISATFFVIVGLGLHKLRVQESDVKGV